MKNEHGMDLPRRLQTEFSRSEQIARRLAARASTESWR
jgi:hypothetical protein